MLRFILISALVALSFGARTRRIRPLPDGRIVGGVETTIEEYPHQLSLQYLGGHSCGASILSDKLVLTAAHCTDGRATGTLTVRASSSRRGGGGQVVYAIKVCQHPQYNPVTIDNDVSVLQLAAKIELGPTAQPIALQAKDEDVAVGTLATVTGWGKTDEAGFPATFLQAVEVPRVSDEACNKSYDNKITAQMFCFGYTEGQKDACQGDSGGPLILDNKQIGIVSWGYGCARPDRPGIYSKVSSLRDHIDSCFA